MKVIKLLFTIFAIIGGLAISLQASINGGLGKRIGTIETSFVSFAIGTLALLFMVIFLGKGNILAIGTAPKWQLTGGAAWGYLCICHGLGCTEAWGSFNDYGCYRWSVVNGSSH